MKKISLAESVWAIERAGELLNTKEPIGPLDNAALIKLNTTIEQPFVSFGGRYHYWFMYQRAAALFYYIIKDHCLQNGNKRSAVLITVVFLIINNKTLSFGPTRMYDLACKVAESSADSKDEVIALLCQLMKESIVDLPPLEELEMADK